MAIIERTHLPLFVPEHFVISIGIEGRIDVDQINAGVRELRQLIQIIPAVDDLRIDERRRAKALRIVITGHSSRGKAKV